MRDEDVDCSGFALGYLIWSQHNKHLALFILPKPHGYKLRSSHGSYSCIDQSRPYLNILPLDFLVESHFRCYHMDFISCVVLGLCSYKGGSFSVLLGWEPIPNPNRNLCLFKTVLSSHEPLNRVLQRFLSSTFFEMQLPHSLFP